MSAEDRDEANSAGASNRPMLTAGASAASAAMQSNKVECFAGFIRHASKPALLSRSGSGFAPKGLNKTRRVPAMEGSDLIDRAKSNASVGGIFWAMIATR